MYLIYIINKIDLPLFKFKINDHDQNELYEIRLELKSIHIFFPIELIIIFCLKI